MPLTISGDIPNFSAATITAGTITTGTVTTLNALSGVLATQNGMTGIAKAWVNFNGTGTVAIRDSFNVSSITDNGTGDYTVNFTTAMPNANYCVQGTMGNASGGANAVVPTNGGAVAPTTTSINVAFYVVGAASDPTYGFIAVFSS